MSLVEEFYKDAQKEWDRLLPLCRIEFASTLGLIETYFTRGLRVADLGRDRSLAGRRMQSEETLLRARAIGCREPRMPSARSLSSGWVSRGV